MQFRGFFDLWLLETDFSDKRKTFLLQNQKLLSLGIQNVSSLKISIKGMAWL